MPAVNLPPTGVAARTGRVVIDATDGPMRVVARFDPSFVPPGGPVERGRSGELCVTPCVVDLPVGKYRLFLSATEAVDSSVGDTDDVIIDEGVQVYRRAPGRYRTPTATDALGPAMVIVVSLVALSAGSALAVDDASRGAGAGLLIGGVVGGSLGGVWAYDKSRATQQDGASSTWRVAR